MLFFTKKTSACNDETTEITNTVGLEKIEEGSSMPKCNSDKDGLMVYVVDSAAAYYCADGKWLLLNGKDGADGKDGTEGKDGKDGDDGKSAYEIANAANKFKSEEEWLNSLKGANGESCKGEVVENGIKITCDNETDDFGFSALPIGRYLTTIERPSSSDPGVVVDPTGIEYSTAEAFFQYNSENPIAYMSVSSDNEKALIEASSDVCIRIVGDTRPCNFHYYKQSVRCIKD